MKAPPASRAEARRSVLYATIAPILWLAGMATFTLTSPGISPAFRAHLAFGLSVFACVVIVPLLLLFLTLNWLVKRIAALVIVVLFIGMARGGVSQGFGWAADAGIVLLCAGLLGIVLFFLSRPTVMTASGDYYNFLAPSDVFSSFSFRRKLESTRR